ncbi:MAG: glycosyltransferase family 39 protein [Planctomycetota bacterium]
MEQRINSSARSHVVASTSMMRWCVAAICVGFGGLSLIGIRWGLPGRHLDATLFGSDEPWSGKRIYELAGGVGKFSATVGADVDVDPLSESPKDEPRDLTAHEADVARIYLRYRLYTHQPDEMITMMALAGMDPRRFQFDPRLYQYGGLFIYPVGAMIAAADLIGAIDVRSDVVHYLDHPDEFGKFYVVARLYSALWGMVGVIAVAAIGRRLGGNLAAGFASLLFALMPVVVCMSHEGKPHLPGAVLMLLAVLCAMRHLARERTDSRADWWKMCVCCGAAVGMVLSSGPIWILVPLVAFLDRGRADAKGGWATLSNPCVGGLALCVGVYLVSNPYIVINGWMNQEVLRSNFGNSLAMYEVSRCFEGLIRVLELTIEGSGFPIFALGAVALVCAMRRHNSVALPLVVTGILFFLQFVLIGAGKPAEYGRFGVFPNTVLAIGAACLLARIFDTCCSTTGPVESVVESLGRPVGHRILAWVVTLIVLVAAGLGAIRYEAAFWADSGPNGSRARLAKVVESLCAKKNGTCEIVVPRQPAPYCCPPLNFARTRVVMERSVRRFGQAGDRGAGIWINPVDVDGVTDWTPARDRVQPTDSMSQGGSGSFPRMRAAARMVFGAEPMISWADKPFDVRLRSDERK